MVGIYKITSPSGKIYIGQSVNIEKRFHGYLNDKTKYLNQTRLIYSINKYGVINHSFEIIEICDIVELNVRERYWQDYYDVIGVNGLNCRLTTINDKSGKLSKETIDKIIKSNKGRIVSDETRLLMSINNARNQLGKKGNKNHNFGKKLSDETKKLISQKHLGKIVSQETRLKLSQLKKGITFSEISKNKMRESSPKTIKILNIDTNEIIFGIRQASKEIGIGRNILSEMLHNKRENITNLILLQNE